MGRRIAQSPWHAASWERLIAERLPALLAERLPLANYHVDHNATSSQLSVTLAGTSGDIDVRYPDIPRPDERGVFVVEGAGRVVVPLAAHDDLATASIRCVGEQVYDYIGSRLGEAPAPIAWDEALVRALLPLDAWIVAFFRTEPTSQVLDQTNWLATQNHLHRIVIEGRTPDDVRPVFGPNHGGRVCPFEMPEGPNIGRTFVLARGAEIQHERLVIVDDALESQLGWSASMIPLLEHDDPTRLLMGSNMLRQWLPLSDAEPALVQSGFEPDAPNVWCGRNLLTAFVSWGAATYEDGIVLSASGARRLGYPSPVEPGDKLSNRHGIKGVVAQIVPDADMPQLADGTPVECIYTFISFHARGFFGTVREAVLGRIAHAEGTPFVAPPFAGPGSAAIRERLTAAGLSGDGMEQLHVGPDDAALPNRSTVGWVYWGRLYHTAHSKGVATTTADEAQRQGVLEYEALVATGATQFAYEQFNLRSARRDGAATLAQQVASGEIAAPQSTPYFDDLQARLALAGIALEQRDNTLHARWHERDDLVLAQPVPHPWLQERRLSALGIDTSRVDDHAVQQANRGIQRVLHGNAPPFMMQRAQRQLHRAIGEYFDVLLRPEHLLFDTFVTFSGRAVLAPADGLRLDQVGVPDGIAWTLYGPQLAHRVGAAAVTARDERASVALDALMLDSWVVVNRAPSLNPTTFVAFHPVRRPERVLRLHPLVCRFLQADFDGDQAAIFLPLRQATQNEVSSRLSVAGHLRRDPTLAEQLMPSGDALFGLVLLAHDTAGRNELAQRGIRLEPATMLTREALAESMTGILARQGVEATLDLLQWLLEQGLSAAQASGASISPLLDHTPTALDGDHATSPILVAQALEELRARSPWEGELGPQRLAISSGAWGTWRQLGKLLGLWEQPVVVNGQSQRIEHGYCDGLSATELFAEAYEVRESFARIAHGVFGQEHIPASVDRHGTGFLQRARRSPYPGIVFARAATNGDIDPLTDPTSRSFVGLE